MSLMQRMPAGTGMSWNDSDTWATNLVYNGHMDWRLPSPKELNGTGPFTGYGTGYTSEFGGLAGDGISSFTPGPFTNLNLQSEFWTDTSIGEDDAISYAFGYGNVARSKTIVLGPNNEPLRRLGAWAVRDAAAPVPAAVVPLPAAVWLFASGLLGFGLIGRQRRRSML